MFAIHNTWLRLRDLLHFPARNGSIPQPRSRITTLEGFDQAVIDAVPGNVALLDTRGVITAVNKAWSLFAIKNGLPDVENFGIGTNYLDVCGNVFSEARGANDSVATAIRNVLSGAQPSFSVEYPCHGPMEQNWFLLTVSPLGAPQPYGALIIHVNVTANKQVEASLSASELQFDEMAESIRDIFFLADTRSKQMLYISPAYEEIFGHDCASMYADRNAWLASVSSKDRQRLDAEYRAHLKKGNVRFNFVFQITRPDQSLRWIAMKVFSIRDETGKVTRVTGVAEDITESRNAARALRESEFRLRELLNRLGLVSVMVDRDENITFCNEALSQLTGRHHDDIVGQKWYELFRSDDQDSTRQHYARLLADQPQKGRHENRLYSGWGESHTICWTSSIMRARTGEVIGMAAIGEDITDQKQEAAKILVLNANLEKLSIRLIQAQEQERISLARELHDELGQRLALLKMDLHQLRQHLVEPDAIGIWDTIDASIVTLIGQIRVISVSLRPPALDYLGLESAIRQLLERQFANSRTTCVIEYAGLPQRLDPAIEIAVYRIVQECVTNIVRHARAGHVVVEINGGEAGGELELIIRDNGIGFDRVAITGTIMPPGGSTGLTGMQERVELLGGTFSVETEVGHGTRVMASFNLKPQA